MMDSDEHRAERADHEAGHYVSAYVLGIPHRAVYVTIEFARKPGTEVMTGGTCSLDHLLEPTPDQWGTYLAAGWAAQLHGAVLRNGWESPSPEFLDAANRIHGEAGGDLLQMQERLGDDVDVWHYWKLARGLVIEHWAVVQELSRELQAQGSLYQDEATLLVRGQIAGTRLIRPALAVYRKFRREIEVNEVFRSRHPACPRMFETFEEFKEREGCRRLEDFPAWYFSKMGTVCEELEGEVEEYDEDEVDDEEDEVDDDEEEKEDEVDDRGDADVGAVSETHADARRRVLGLASQLYEVARLELGQRVMKFRRQLFRRSK